MDENHPRVLDMVFLVLKDQDLALTIFKKCTGRDNTDRFLRTHNAIVVCTALIQIGERGHFG